MSLVLTPAILEAAYEFLRVCPPFKAWRLPPADDVEFHVIARPDREGEYTRYCGTDDHIIGISGKRIGHTSSLIIAMAHEMIHLKQARAKTETKGAEHNAEFGVLSKRVCRIHGWDEKVFC